MADLACSEDGCDGDVSFTRVYLTTTGSRSVHFCKKHKENHDRRVRDSFEYEKLPPPVVKKKTPEDSLADSAILIIRKLAEMGTEDATRALDTIRSQLT